jgi:hypothetical protein
MEPTHPTDLTIGQAYGGLLKTFVEQHKLVENQVLTLEEAEKLLNHSCDAPKPLEIQDLLHRVSRAYTQNLRKELRPQLEANPVASPFASDKVRDFADDTANDAYAAGARTFYAYRVSRAVQQSSKVEHLILDQRVDDVREAGQRGSGRKDARHFRRQMGG